MIPTTATPALPTMRPYHKQGEIDYARLDYNPDEPVLKPDAMQQNPPLHEILGSPPSSGGPTSFSKPTRSSATTRTTSTSASPRTCT